MNANLTTHNSMTKQQGLTLVELMVGLVIAMLVTAAASSIYIAQRVNSTLGKEMTTLQSEGSRATDALARDLRQAGDYNCAITPGVSIAAANANASVFTGYDASAKTINLSGSSIRSFTTMAEINAAAGYLGQTAIYTALNGTNTNDGAKVIAITGTLENETELAANLALAGTSATVVHKSPSFAAGQQLVISDCVNASVVKVSAYTAPNGGTTTGTLTIDPAPAADYKTSTSISRITTVWWFYGTPCFTGSCWPKGLYRVDGDKANSGTGAGFKLISKNISDLVFNFEADTSATADGVIDVRRQTSTQIQTGAADEAAKKLKWKNIRRISTKILMKSEKNVFQDFQNYFFNNTATTAQDKKLYLPLELTVSTRN